MVRVAFLDTEVFIHENFSYSSPRFQGLRNLVRDSDVVVKLTDVTAQEVRSKLGESLRTAETAVLQARSKGRLLRNLTQLPVHGMFAPLDMKSAEGELLRQFEAFLRVCNVEIVAADGVSITGVFADYFAGAAPFAGKSKPQFPDAFALAAIEQWCEVQSRDAYVVSGDSDFKDACELSTRMTCVPSLNELLSLILTETEEERVRLVVRLFGEHHRLAVKALADCLVDEPAFMDDDESDAVITEIKAATFKHVTVVAIGDREAMLEAVADIGVGANVSFVDPDKEYYDVDGELVYAERVEGWTEGPVEAPIHFSVRYSKDDDEPFEILSAEVNEGEQVYLYC